MTTFDQLRRLKVSVYVDGKLSSMNEGEVETQVEEMKTYVLEDETESLLNLSYAPYSWPHLGKFRSDLGMNISLPADRDRSKRWYPKAVAAFDRRISFLGSNVGKWVNCEFCMALVPDAEGKRFSAVVNGVTLVEEFEKSLSIRRRMLLQGLEIKVTLCRARITGGGSLSDGRARGYWLAIDLKRFRADL